MNIHILVGTTSGNTEYLAEQLQGELTSQGHTVVFHDQPDYANVPQSDCLWLLCIATHGAGEYADSIAPLMETLQREQPLLSALKFAIIAVGDSSYDTFCQAGRDAESLLLELSAQQIAEPLTIDMLLELDPESTASDWLESWRSQRS